MHYELFFSDKDKSKFPNQQLLNNKILISNYSLQTNEANALTIRLLVADEALYHLKNNLSQINKASKDLIAGVVTFNFQNPTLSSKEVFLPIISGSASVCTLIGVTVSPGMSYQDIKNAGYLNDNNFITVSNNPLVFRNIVGHMELYNYFSNFSSVLDRFSQEINLLFDLRINKIDWNYLLLGSNTAPVIKRLRLKYPALSSLIDKFHSQTAMAHLMYRNRLIHDGLVKFETRFVNDELGIFLQQDPEVSTSPFSVSALNLCTDGFEELLQFLDSSYGVFIQIIDNIGQPPWSV